MDLIDPVLRNNPVFGFLPFINIKESQCSQLAAIYLLRKPGEENSRQQSVLF